VFFPAIIVLKYLSRNFEVQLVEASEFETAYFDQFDPGCQAQIAKKHWILDSFLD
jgi:hypothetical protein